MQKLPVSKLTENVKKMLEAGIEDVIIIDYMINFYGLSEKSAKYRLSDIKWTLTKR